MSYSLRRERRRPLSDYYSDEDRLSRSPSVYSSCESVDEIVERYRNYNRRVRVSVPPPSALDMVSSFSDLDDNTVINQGTSELRQPQLLFHSVHGQNVELRKERKLARRKESFCKALAFSSRSIAVEENVCIRLAEVGVNWSGVLRFGVTNVDPETFRNIPVPKFACPDLTSKDGYWAKALPERYSIEGHILHFYVTAEGELHYGIDGTQKGVFLVGINTNLPLWVLVDIYGNSVAVEFVDPADYRPARSSRTASTAPTIATTTSYPNPNQDVASVAEDVSQLTVTQTQGTSRNMNILRFHDVTGRNITLNSGRTVAERCEREYTQGYVFTERPIANNEKVVIQVLSKIKLYSSGLAFGVTCCDPSNLRLTDLPDDPLNVIDMKDYWVSIKDIALQPRPGTTLSFWITDKGEVKFERDSVGQRTVLHVDNTLPLYMFFDCFGSTQSIKLLGITSSRNPSSLTSRATSAAPPRVALPSIPNTTRREAPPLPSSTSRNGHQAPLRVDLRSASSSSGVRSSMEDSASRVSRPTVDDILFRSISTTATPVARAAASSSPRPPPLGPRPLQPSSTSSLPTGIPAPPNRPPPPTPTERRTMAENPMVSMPLLQPPPAMPAPTLSGSFINDLLRPSVGVPLHSVGSSPAFLAASSSMNCGTSTASTTSLSASTTMSGNDGNGEDEDNECTICMSARINSVIYTCGHMCMCFNCATQMKEGSGLCPICRNSIKDVIKIYKS